MKAQTTQKPEAVPKIKLASLTAQLDKEWAAFTADYGKSRTTAEMDTLVWYHASIRIALHWVNGDPYTCTWPVAYQTQRLVRLCAYLKSLQAAEPVVVKKAREAELARLKSFWQEYAALAVGEIPEGMTASEMECPPFTWDGVGPQQWAGYEGTEEPRDLPAFAQPIIENWYLACIAVLYLNRQLRYALTDLIQHSTGE